MHVIALGKSEEIPTAAEQIRLSLSAQGNTVILDERVKARPGEKLAAAEIIGVPWQIVLGRDIAEGKIELRSRRSGEIVITSMDEAVKSFE